MKIDLIHFNPDLPVHNEKGIVARLGINAENPLSLRGLRELAWKGERIRKRYENGCNYVWATGDSYQRGTEMIERATIALARDIGLHCHLQLDPRGACVYVSRDPISETNYSCEACLFYERDDI